MLILAYIALTIIGLIAIILIFKHWKSIRRRVPLKILQLPTAHKVWWGLLKTCIIGLPAAALGICRWPFSVPEAERSTLYKLTIDFSDFISASPPLIVFLFLLPVLATVFFGFYEEVSRSFLARNSLDAVHLTEILSSIDKIVGHKLNRFKEYLTEIQKSPSSRSAVFLQITQPQLQTTYLIEQLYLTLRLVTKVDDIKVALVSMRGGNPSEYLGFSPADEAPSETILKNGTKSFFAVVAKQNRPLLIRDIGDHVASNTPRTRKFFVGDGSEPKGSIMGFRIFDKKANKTVQVLTVKSDTPEAFSTSILERSQKVVRVFEKRLVLEHHLFCIKSEVEKWPQ